jgi:hypothetical protein
LVPDSEPTVEKASKMVGFWCTAREHESYKETWGKNNLSKTIRLLLNAAVAARAARERGGGSEASNERKEITCQNKHCLKATE